MGLRNMISGFAQVRLALYVKWRGVDVKVRNTSPTRSLFIYIRDCRLDS